MAKFKREVLDKIKADPDLYGIVCKAMGIQPNTLSSTIDRNGKSLNQFGVVTAVAAYLNVEAGELVEIPMAEQN